MQQEIIAGTDANITSTHTTASTHITVFRPMTKNGVRAIREPSAIARLRMRRVVTECFRARARTLQIMKRFPGKPREKD
ncbi:hypothetical protein F7725_004726 [Dissostichus mawsoni]|uniref:Uncharacterized protein n=1 Tax=Dissostichus mawsoni TaxID=36200 RepID=A0A7J5XJY3_DISMA|nr:hypothetical protein F7725_004726 [Dissostichus mawsoni]